MKLYRFLSADDTSEFCHKVTAALNKGGNCGRRPMPLTRPTVSCAAGSGGEGGPEDYPPDVKLGEQ